ncbi:discoidin domain-containing protein, partial [Spirochaetota bacterium]
FNYGYLSGQSPVIDVWYGNTQNFGKKGTPQQWINILGKVTDEDGDLSSLSYSLNGGEQRILSVAGDGSASDGLRLWNEGEFNIDLDKNDLFSGNNQVIITGVDAAGNVSGSAYVTVNYDRSTTWPLPYTIDWKATSSIEDVAQIVDGKWALTGTGIRPVETGFDRLIAIGEGSFAGEGWKEYEVTVEVTVHGYHNDGFLGTQVAPAIGIVARWQGHTDFPISGCQPKCGWMPVGGVSWYTWDRNNRDRAYFAMWAHSADKKLVPNSPMMDLNVPYYWKMRIENTISPRGTYFLKIWKKGESEPAQWLARFDETMRNWSYTMLESGSIMLLSHHVDVTFGDVQINPLGSIPDATATPIATATSSPTPSSGTVKLSISSVSANKNSSDAVLTLDSNYATRWVVVGDPVWIEYDLDAVKTVAEVHVQWYRGNERINYFNIETSADGNTFNNVFSGESSGTTTDLEKYTVNTTAQYIRIIGHGNSVDTDPWTSISEVEIYGSGGGTPTTSTPTPEPTFTPIPTATSTPTGPGTDPVKLSGSIFGSGNAYLPGREYDKIFDSDIHTYFDCTDPSGGYAGIELASDATLSAIRFHPRIDPRDWSKRMIGGRFQGSANGTDYTDMYTITSLPDAAWNEINLPDQSPYKYLRYIGSVDGYCNVAEIEFWGVEGTPEITPTPTAAPIPTATPPSEINKLPISSVDASKNTANAAMTLDSDYATRWVVIGDPVWVEYDLGAVRTVTEVHIQWFKGDQRAFFFDIELSENGADFQRVFSGKSSGFSIKFEKYGAAGSARYVRIVGHGNTVDADPWTSISEVEIWGSVLGAPELEINNKNYILVNKSGMEKKIYSISAEKGIDLTPILNSMTIEPEDAVRVSIYDIRGNFIRNVYNGTYAYDRKVLWNLLTIKSEKPVSGVYIYSVRIDGNIQSFEKKGTILLVR